MNAPEYPSLWNLPANPVFRRHAVARLRPWPLAGWVLITQAVAGFAWAASVLGYLHAQARAPLTADFSAPEFQRVLEAHGTEAFLLGWMVVLVLQGVLAIMKGTFSVATGVAREAHEGMIEAERLTPLPIGHKVVGQLLGLPVLETVLALLMLVWAGLSAWLGGLSPAMMGRVYLLFFTAAVFHHAVGLVAGTLIRQKILAGTISQLLVLLLHFVLPSFGGLGLGPLAHLGAQAAIVDEIAAATPGGPGRPGLFTQAARSEPVEFFQWEIAVSGYHWLITVSALAALVTVLVRRWETPDSQLLGKRGTILLAAWMLILACGELLPGIWRGEGVDFTFRSSALSLTFNNGTNGAPPFLPGALWSASFALVLGSLNLVLTGTLIPSPAARALCRGSNRCAWWSDGRNALPWVAFHSVMVTAAWAWVVGSLVRETPALASLHLRPAAVLWMTASILLPAWTWHALVLWKGWRTALLTGFLIWAAPVMISCLGLLLSAETAGWPAWLGAVSGPLLPLYASLNEIPGAPWAGPRGALPASLGIHAAATAWLLIAPRRRPRFPRQSSVSPDPQPSPHRPQAE